MWSLTTNREKPETGSGRVSKGRQNELDKVRPNIENNGSEKKDMQELDNSHFLDRILDSKKTSHF